MSYSLEKHAAALAARVSGRATRVNPDNVSGSGESRIDANVWSPDAPLNRGSDDIVDNIPGMIFQRQLHPDGTISFPYANKAVFEISGLDPTLIAANPAAVSDRVHPDDLIVLQEAVRRSFANMEPHSEEFRFHHPTLGWRWFQTISKPRQKQDGTIVADALALDITDRKKTEQELELNRMRLNDHLSELQDTKERLEQRTDELIRTVRDLAEARDEAEIANRAKSDFLATMSHEIRTPMNGVLGMASLMIQTPLDEAQREFVETITQSGEALLDIINDVLDYSKMEAGQFDLDPTNFSVLEVIDSAVQLIRPKCQEKSLTIRTFADPEIPVELVGDAGRLRQILLNLLGNAAKFTKSGTITLECFQPAIVGHKVELSFAVTDTGIGIPADAQHALFEVFSQADASTTRKFGGTGLGLSISKRLCHLMDGEITVNSTPGEGSTFSFTIQCTQSENAEVRMSTQRNPDLPRCALITAAAMEPDTGLSRQLHAYGITNEIFDDADKLLDRLSSSTDDRTMMIIDSDALTRPGDLARRLNELYDTRPFTLWVHGATHPDLPELPDFARSIDIPLRQSRLRQYIEALATSSLRKPEDTPAAGRDADARPPAPARTQNSTETKNHTEPSPTVLLVEDNKVNQRVAMAILEAAGMSVTLAENGQEALDLLQQHEFGVILMDIHMPLMDGITAAKKIRALPQPHCDIPIIALTANAMKGDRETYLDAGMNDYVSKPVDPNALSEAIRRQAGVAPTTSTTKTRSKSNSIQPSISESQVSRLFAGLDDILE